MGLQLLDHALDHGENYQLILSETAFSVEAMSSPIMNSRRCYF